MTNEADNEYFFPSQKQCELTPDQKNTCEEELTKIECLDELKVMENSISPGEDGLSAELYKVFWNNISTININAINTAYKTGKLSISQRRGIIKLMPKKNSIPFYLKNWRPITLLSCDYKVATKAIANRLKAVLPHIIENDQTGFFKRTINKRKYLINRRYT